jgi:ParB/RepB/Spo0J family partition protein
MHMTPATAAPAAPVAGATELVDAPLNVVHESEYNTRHIFTEASLQELADSIKAKGQLTPGLARPHPTKKGYELAAGARRRRALERAGLPTMLLLVRPMTDVEFLEVITIENLQREDITALEEAAGYQALLNLPLSGYDVPKLAAKVGKSEKFIYDRLKLLELGPDAQKQLQTGKITASHAILLARLDHAQQKEVLAETARRTEKDAVPSVRDFNFQIEQTVRHHKRLEAIELEMTKAQAAYPDAKKIWRLAEFGGHGIDKIDLGYGGWQEVKADTPGALVGVFIGDHSREPKLVHFKKVEQRNGGSRPSGPAYGSKEWKLQQAERERKEKDRARRRAAGELAVRSAFAEAAAKLDDRAFWLTVLHEIMDHVYIADAIEEAFALRFKLPWKGGTVGDFRHSLRRDEEIRKALAKLGPEQLKAAILFMIVDPPKEAATNQYEGNDPARVRTEQLAKALKLDLPTIVKDAQTAADAAHKAAKAKAPSAKLKPKARPKAKAKKGIRKPGK